VATRSDAHYQKIVNTVKIDVSLFSDFANDILAGYSETSLVLDVEMGARTVSGLCLTKELQSLSLAAAQEDIEFLMAMAVNQSTPFIPEKDYPEADETGEANKGNETALLDGDLAEQEFEDG